MEMFDSIDVSQIPKDAKAAAGYVDGLYQTWPELKRLFPNAHLLSITVTAAQDAECLDVENGDATPQQAPDWVKRQHARGLKRPVVYASISTMALVLSLLEQAGIGRGQVRLWSAHYTFAAHICGLLTCGWPTQVDATQWTDHALGRNLDESLVNADFFGQPKPPPPSFTEADMLQIPPSGVPLAVPIPEGRNRVLLFSAAGEAKLKVEFHARAPEDVAVSWVKGAETVAVPNGLLQARITRTDAGTDSVTVAVG